MMRRNIVRNIHFSSKLLFKRAEFIKLIKSTFHDTDDPKVQPLYNIGALYETTIKQHYYNFLLWFIEWDL